MSDPEWKELLDEAADIFVRLRENPEDEAALEDQEAFVARGETERRAYAHINKVWQASGVQKKPNRPVQALVFALLLGAAIWGGPQTRIHLASDYSTWRDPKNQILISGDVVDLDASSALDENIDATARAVEVLKGAAFFKVNKDHRPFVVTIGDLTVEVLGTEFETSFHDGDVVVAVHEGTVSIRHKARDWVLNAGERMIFDTRENASVERISTETVAGWRMDSFVAEGLTFGQVVAVMDRRIPGEIVILNKEIADIRVSGHYDLSDPMSALRLLATTVGANVRAFPPIATIVTR